MILLFLFFLLVSNSLVISKKPNDCFRAAVYEHLFVKEPIEQPLKVLENNLAIFERVIKKAAKYEADIIVFPEYALVHELPRPDTLSKGIASFLPDLNVKLCEEPKNKNVEPGNEIEKITDEVSVNKFLLKRLSCAAKKYEIYISANLFEIIKNPNKTESSLNFQDQDYLLYNVNVVFDKEGKLVAKYRKKNLFDESAMTQPLSQPLSHFESDFGRFGVAICADSLFKNPINDLVEKEKIDHLIFSHAWADSLPHVASLNFHVSMAMKYKINVLSSNQRNYTRKALGSGIYDKDGVRVQTFLDDKHNHLAIADLPKGNSNAKCNYKKLVKIGKKEYKEFNHLLENLDENEYRSNLVPRNVLKSIPLESNEGKIERVCANDICCSVSWKKINGKYNCSVDLKINSGKWLQKTSDKSENYHLIISSGLNHTTDKTCKLHHYEEGCAIASFDPEKQEYSLSSSAKFDSLILKGEFNSTEIYANVLSANLRPLPATKYAFNQDQNKAEISLQKTKSSINIVSLFVRNYDKYIKDPFRIYEN